MLTISVAVTGHAEGHLMRAFRSGGGLLGVLAEHFGVEGITARPGEYAVLEPRCIAASGGPHAVQVRLTGVTRNPPKRGYEALITALQQAAEKVVERVLPAIQAAEVASVEGLPPPTQQVWGEDNPEHRGIPMRVTPDQKYRTVQPKVQVAASLAVHQLDEQNEATHYVRLNEPSVVTCEPVQVPCAARLLRQRPAAEPLREAALADT